MRTSTSLAALVALMAVTSSASPIGINPPPTPSVSRMHGHQHARGLVPNTDLNSEVDVDLYHAVDDKSKSVGDAVKVSLNDGSKIANAVPPVHANVNLSTNEPSQSQSQQAHPSIVQNALPTQSVSPIIAVDVNPGLGNHVETPDTHHGNCGIPDHHEVPHPDGIKVEVENHIKNGVDNGNKTVVDVEGKTKHMGDEINANVKAKLDSTKGHLYQVTKPLGDDQDIDAKISVHDNVLEKAMGAGNGNPTATLGKPLASFSRRLSDVLSWFD